jgi:2-hydroxychromene-2-carboxylate isomerase
VGARVEFVFGLGSRYSYLASTQLEGIASRTGCSFDWIPVSSVALMAARGKTPFRGDPVSGQYDWDYRRRDAEDWARYYGVPYVEPHPAPEDHALMAVATRAAESQARLVAYARAMFDAVFAQHRKVDREVCIEIARTAGLDAARYQAAFDDPAVRARVDADARKYAQQGAFGVPSFFCGGRMYWGNDRLVLLEDGLRRGA